jgi:hypothetical protein
MRYNITQFEKEAAYYKRLLKEQTPKSILVFGDYTVPRFLSLAPFSKACAGLGIDIHVSLNSSSFRVLCDIWETYENITNKKIGENEKALKDFLTYAPFLEQFIKKPDMIIGSNMFFLEPKWFRPVMPKKLRETTDTLIKNVFALKKSERFSIGFALIPKKLNYPIEDYLDSYAICNNMFQSASKVCHTIMKANTEKESMLDMPEPISELITTLIGCELEKDIDLPVFQSYKKLSACIRLERLKIANASFFISTKGYHGKHLFGEKIGYPTKNMKDKWTGPSGLIHKLHWSPQSENEDRDPIGRYAFTSTVPIERLIESCLIDYNIMRKRNDAIKRVLQKCDKVLVKSKFSDFEVCLKKEGKRRLILGSDSDVRTLIHPQVLKERGKRMGRMGNIPGGEAFTTPFFIKGKIIGDVVINIDKSYRLDCKEPLVAVADENGYKILSGPKNVLLAFRRKRKDAWNNIIEMEKNKSVSEKIIEMKKKNFNNIGEFAINTNPKAKLCDYLIINEKIANMIHVAFGSGFEADSSTEYHMDVVIDAPRQKLDICGVGKRTYWIMRKGKLCV